MEIEVIAAKPLFDQGGKSDAGSEKKCVTLDIDIYILYRTFVWLFETVFRVGPGGFDL